MLATLSLSFSPAQPKDCLPCHESIYESYLQTAHFKTSQPANRESIKGSFAQGENILRTANPDVLFKMVKRGDGFYQNGYQAGKLSRSERFDLVVGSGRKGQSYLFWEDGLLYQLPVSYFTLADEWVNSPGYENGKIFFGRLIPPQCLECHATSFELERRGSRVAYSNRYELGISCQKCHGPGDRHVQYHDENPEETSGRYILNPASFSRERRIDNCALCHSGLREPKMPPFTSVPGQALDDYLMPAHVPDDLKIDVHGNQAGLLRSSRCFKESPEMSCSTCHDIHAQERDLASLSQKCLQCHRPHDWTLADPPQARIDEFCVSCHMPDQRSDVVTLESKEGLFPRYRNHAIGVYPEESKQVLRQLRR
ncbi:MAG: multiheme c-type cytochrome [Acidobacteriota bacterium]